MLSFLFSVSFAILNSDNSTMITPSVTAGQDFTFLALGRKRLCQLYFKRIALNIFFFSFLLKQCWIPGGLFLVAGTSKLPWVGWWKPIIEGISKHLWCFSSNAWTFVSNAFKRNFHSMWKHQEIIDAREGQKFQPIGEGDLSRPYRQKLASRVLIDLPLSNHVGTQTCWKFGK